MKVAIVHDDLVQWGGAERVLLGLCEIYPDAPIYTSIYDQNNETLRNLFGSRKVITSFLKKIPASSKLYKTLMPFYPLAFEQFNFDEYDLVISHTTRFAKGIITKPHTKHICYMHTPPRFLWHLSERGNYGFGEFLMSKLRIYDAISANRVDVYLAGSKNAKKRIEKIYKRDSKVLYPFVDLERFKNIESFNGEYFLVVSRLNKYKRVELAVQACLELGLPIKVIGAGPEMNNLVKIGGQVEFLGELDDEMLVQVMAGCQALIISGIEDFGLTALEAQALGKSVIAYRYGGALETVIDGKTGILFDTQTVESIKEAIKRLKSLNLQPHNCWENAQHFSKEKFIQNFQAAVASLV